MKFHTVVSTIVNSSFEKAWEELWRKVYETKDFLPGIKQLTIHQKNDDQVLRTMSFGQFTLKERIVKDSNSHTIYFHNIKASDIQGLIYNSLYYNDKKQLILQFGSDASGKNGQLFPPGQILGKGLMKTKQVIEKP